jgi:ABC-type branched-subunit amino acid transport system ATPase component
MAGPSERDLAIEATALVKTFGEIRAVDGVDLAVGTGMVYGLLGPNGAGKTTAIRMLATLLRPDSGAARVFGHDIVREADAVRGRVSLTGQYASVRRGSDRLREPAVPGTAAGPFAGAGQTTCARAARGVRP